MQEGEAPTNWQFTDTSGDGQANAAPTQPTKTVSWTASEYVSHEKSAGWYVRFGLVAVVAIAIVYLITGDYISIILLSLLAVVFVVFAARKPDVLQYQLDNRGITIGSKFYPVSLFRSFAVIEEGAFRSITLLPMKRFMPSISLYYAPEDEQPIMEAFGRLLPHETRQQDSIDKFMHRIRF